MPARLRQQPVGARDTGDEAGAEQQGEHRRGEAAGVSANHSHLKDAPFDAVNPRGRRPRRVDDRSAQKVTLVRRPRIASLPIRRPGLFGSGLPPPGVNTYCASGWMSHQGVAWNW